MAPVSTECESAGQILNKLVGAGKADLGVAARQRRAMRCSSTTAFGTEISRFGCCIPSRRLVSNSSTFLVLTSVISICSRL